MPDYEGCTINHNSNGSITLCYTPLDPGTYKIIVEREGLVCPGFPVNCSVQKYGADYVTSYETGCSDPLPPIVYQIDQVSDPDQSSHNIQSLEPTTNEIKDLPSLDQSSVRIESASEETASSKDKYDIPTAGTPTTEVPSKTGFDGNIQGEISQFASANETETQTAQGVGATEKNQLIETFIVKDPEPLPVTVIKQCDNIMLVKRDVKVSYVCIDEVIRNVGNVKDEREDATGTLPMSQDATDMLPMSQDATGTLPMSQDATGMLPMSQDATGTLPMSQDATGTLPMSEDAMGTLPISQDATGMPSMPQDAIGMPPIQQDSTGMPPIQQDATGMLPMSQDAMGTLPISQDATVMPPIQQDATGMLPIQQDARDDVNLRPLFDEGSNIDEKAKPSDSLKGPEGPLATNAQDSSQDVTDQRSALIKGTERIPVSLAADAVKDSISKMTPISESDYAPPEPAGQAGTATSKKDTFVDQSLSPKIADKPLTSNEPNTTEMHTSASLKIEPPTTSTSELKPAVITHTPTVYRNTRSAKKRGVDEDNISSIPKTTGRKRKKNAITKSSPLKTEKEWTEKESFSCEEIGCSSSFSSMSELESHASEHNIMTNPKTIDERPTGVQQISNILQSLKKYKLSDGKTSKLNCSIICCDTPFQNLEAMKKHVEEEHKNDIPKDNKRAAVISSSPKKTTQENGEGKIVKRERRGRKRLRPEEDVSEELRQVLDSVNSNVCPVCDKNFATKGTVKLHIKNMHSEHFGVKKQPIVERVTCDICQKSCCSKYALKEHVERVHEKQRQYTCDEPTCGKSFNGIRDLKRHKLLKHSGQNIPKKHHEPEMCQICGKKVSKGNLKAHIQRKHLAVHGSYKCPVEGCSKSFKLADDLKRHSVVHMNRPQYMCDICNKLFKKELSVRIHIDAVHGQNKQLPCPVTGCKKVFPSDFKLKCHVRAVHRQKRYEHCRVEGCNKVLGDKRALKLHMMVHEGYRWQCTEGDCRKQFTQKHVLLRHIAATHRNITYDFACPHEDCHKRFRFKDSLKTHLKTHTNIRNYECGICEKRFKTKTLLVAHSKIHDESKQYGCDLCQRKFPRRYRLIEHMAKTHNIQIDLANIEHVDGIITMA